MLTVNLAAVDLIMVLSCQPMFCISSFLGYYPVPTCFVFATPATFGGMASINAMAAIAYDRYMMVCPAPENRVQPSMMRSFKISAFVWIYSAIFAILPFFGIGGYHLNGSKTSCTFDYISRDIKIQIHLLLMYVFGFLLPLFLAIFCYYRVFAKVRQSSAQSSTASGGGASKSKSKDTLVAKVSVACVTVFLLTWTPYATICLVGQVFGPQVLSPYTSSIPALIAKSNCIYNPIIYAFGHPGIKKELKRRMKG